MPDDSEIRPLLPAMSPCASPSSPAGPLPAPRRHLPPAMCALLTLMLLSGLAASLYQLPASRVLERRLCAEHYRVHDPSRLLPDGSVPETACKMDAVQRRLAGLQGAMETAWVVGDFAVTVPLSAAAQRRGVGRRAVLWLNLVPRAAVAAWALAVLQLERVLRTRAIVAASCLSVLGGDCVLGSLVYSLAAGLTEDAVERATYFGYLGSIAYVVNLSGPALAAASMSVALWLPLAVSVALVLLCIPVIGRLPAVDDDDDDTPANGTLAASVSRLVAVVRRHPRNFGLLLTGFVLTALASADTRLLTQYISKRYAWTFAQAGYLLSAKAVVNVLLLTVVVPAVLRPKSKRATDTTGTMTDAPSAGHLFLARLCLGVSVVGAVAIGLSASMAALVPALLVYALGSVLPVFTYSLLKAPAIVVPGLHTDTQIFAVVMLAKTLGALVGAPLMAALWVAGITAGGWALGLPYFVSAGGYLVAIGVLSGIRL